MTTGNEIKQCPACGEDIKAIAKKCKHCGEIIDSAVKANNNSPQSKPATNEKFEDIKNKLTVEAVKIKNSITNDYDNGGWKQLIKNKAIIVLLVSFVVLCMMLFGGESSEVKLVKNGTFNGFPAVEIGDVFDSNFDGGEWIYEIQNGRNYVIFTGSVSEGLHNKICKQYPTYTKGSKDIWAYETSRDQFHKYQQKYPNDKITKDFHKEYASFNTKTLGSSKVEQWEDLLIDISHDARDRKSLIRKPLDAASKDYHLVDKLIVDRSKKAVANHIDLRRLALLVKRRQKVNESYNEVVKVVDSLKASSVSSPLDLLQKLETTIKVELLPLLDKIDDPDYKKLIITDAKALYAKIWTSVGRSLHRYTESPDEVSKEVKEAIKSLPTSKKKYEKEQALYDKEFPLLSQKIDAEADVKTAKVLKRKKDYKTKQKLIKENYKLLLAKYYPKVQDKLLLPYGSAISFKWELNSQKNSFLLKVITKEEYESFFILADKMIIEQLYQE